MKLNLGCGIMTLDGFENLDKTNGWYFENGLPYGNESVEGVTISHMMMYVPEDKITWFLSEIYRVLVPGGIVRITEDATDDPRSIRYGGYYDAVSLTSATGMAKHLKESGFDPHIVTANLTYYKDKSLIQDIHGGEPKVFFIEGIKQKC